VCAGRLTSTRSFWRGSPVTPADRCAAAISCDLSSNPISSIWLTLIRGRAPQSLHAFSALLAPATLRASQTAIAILAAGASDIVSKIAIGAAIERGAFAVEIAAMAAGCIVLIGLVAWWSVAIRRMTNC
jgi:hypothetical protein